MIQQRLNALRQEMQAYHLDAYIIPTADPHLSEYLPTHWQAREYFSGFTGSAGVLIVKKDSAQLWTDFRYWTQAYAQLAGSDIVLCKQEVGKNYLADLVEYLPKNSRVGIPSDMLSLAEKRHIEQVFDTKNIALWYEVNLVAAVWNKQRPALPNQAIFMHNVAFVSATLQEKLARVRCVMREMAADYHLISSLDDIAWLTNLRGSDIEYNPVFLAHLLIGPERAQLFVAPDKVSIEIAQELKNAHIDIVPYEALNMSMTQISGTLLFDPNKVVVATIESLAPSVRILEGANPSTSFKAQKDKTELTHIRAAMVQDGIALCGFFAELEERLAQGEVIDEYAIDAMLLHHRAQREYFVSPSFGTIAGFNANGAMPHYTAPSTGSMVIVGDGLLLIDSGGQYHMGTTDITRVIAIGTPSKEQKRDFTLVLKAHIALATAVFPEGIASSMIDAICRAPLWQAQCDYGHGTGHGVGYFLNVHEAPQRISYHAPNSPEYALREGMLTSNEPGLYRPNRWGIRIENLTVTHAISQPQETEFGSYLYFETVTLCPIDFRLIDSSLLSVHEQAWLNEYHAHVYTQLSPHVSGKAKEWLECFTAPI